MEPMVFVKNAKLRITKSGDRRWYGYVSGYKSLLRSQLVMMNFLHTKHISRKFHVHHKDGNTENDAIENLELLSYKQHNEIHNPKDYKYGVSRADDNNAYARAIRTDPRSRDRCL